MKSSALLLVAALLAAPLALALTAFFSGLWQRRDDVAGLPEEELGI